MNLDLSLHLLLLLLYAQKGRSENPKDTLAQLAMEGLGEGYEAFMERLQSDFAVSKSAAQNGNTNPKLHSQIPNPNSNIHSQVPNPNHSQITSPTPSIHGQTPNTNQSPSHNSNPNIHSQIHNAGINNRGNFSSSSQHHHHQQQHHNIVGPSHLHPPKYVGYPSLANAFTLKKKNEEEKERERERERERGLGIGGMSIGGGGIGGGSHSLSDEKNEKPVKKSSLLLPPGFHPIARTVSSEIHRVSEDDEVLLQTTTMTKGHHRRSQSEIAFRLPEDITFDYDQEHTHGFHETDDFIDDFFSSLDFDKMNISQPNVGDNNDNNNNIAGHNSNTNLNHDRPHMIPHHSRSFSVDQMLSGFNSGNNEDAFGFHTSNDDMFLGKGDEGNVGNERPRHRHSHSFSMDGSSSSSSSMQQQKDIGSTSTSSEASKSVSANKLAELALIDPKRAKRILANRQSAARSKERKMRYIAELERKVQALQTEASTLSTQLTLMQNDTTVLTAENNELKFQLKTLEQQTHLSNALNIALKEEFQRLKIATGEVGNNGQLRSREEHPLVSGKPFYRTQPVTESTNLATQQLQQIRSALRKQQHVNHPNNSLA